MTAVLFGSISSIADTSELQRDAFNQAFDAHGLDWHWDRDTYLAMLEASGGEQRIADYASERGEEIDAAAIHATKSERFRDSLAGAGVAPRPGVVETMGEARAHGVKVALVTTTSEANVAALLDALRPGLERSDFELVLDATSVDRPKPDSAVYRFALERLGEDPGDCIAIEDNLAGVRAAVGAGVRCIAFPNENTAGHDFAEADRRVDRVELAALQALIGDR